MLVDAAATADLDRHLDPLLPLAIWDKGHAVAHDTPRATNRGWFAWLYFYVALLLLFVPGYLLLRAISTVAFQAIIFGPALVELFYQLDGLAARTLLIRFHSSYSAW